MVRGTGAITITIDSSKVEKMFRGFERTLPDGARLGTKKIAGMYAETYLNQMKLAGIEKWTRRSFNVLTQQIKAPLRTGTNEYSVVVPTTLIMLDQMRAHFVSLKRGRSITAWAKTKLKITPTFEFTGQTGRVASRIFVSPHPWIENANRNARRRIKRIAEKELNKKIRRKGTR